MSGKLILMNDVSTDVDVAELLVGDSDPVANQVGSQQADIISVFFNKKVPHADLVYSSDAVRLKKLVHKIRTNSKDQHLTSLKVRRLEGLRERGFGILNRTPLSLSSDLFSHTRIKAERGESIFECRVRAMSCIDRMVHRFGNKSILLVSHPFFCQIALNAILQKDHTILTTFWQDKGSFVILNFSPGTYGIKWEFESGNNAISDISYTQDQIYSGLLGKERALPG